VVVTLVSFLHFSVYRHQALTPSVAFTSVRFLSFDIICLNDFLMACLLLFQVAGKSWTQCEWAQVQYDLIVFSEMKFALNALPETLIIMLKSLLSHL
jgi:hypothetical protein